MDMSSTHYTPLSRELKYSALSVRFYLCHFSFTYQHNPRPWGSAGSQVGSYTRSDPACSHIGRWHSLWDPHTHQYLWICNIPMLTSLRLHVKHFSKEMNGSSPQVINDCCVGLSRMKKIWHRHRIGFSMVRILYKYVSICTVHMSVHSCMWVHVWAGVCLCICVLVCIFLRV